MMQYARNRNPIRHNAEIQDMTSDRASPISFPDMVARRRAVRRGGKLCTRRFD